MKFFLPQFNRRKFVILTFLAVVTFAFFFFPQSAKADVIKDAVVVVVGWLATTFINFVGRLLILLIRLLVAVAQYNDFINSPVVNIGWTIIRDICNMFLIVILLIIAFSTVLRIEKYSYKRLLGALLVAAVIVNFSKLICGVIIDFAQVIMLTFVNAFKEAAEGNFAEMLGIKRFLELSKHSEKIGSMEILVGLLLGMILTTVALVVILIMTIILLFRIVVLWFLVLLSPFAFILNILPQTQRYASMWWEKFSHQVVIGPVMAFFIWLSLAVVQQSMAAGNENLTEGVLQLPASARVGTERQLEFGTGSAGVQGAISSIGESGHMLSFFVGIAMLIGSLMVAQQLGVAGGSMAGKAIGKMQKIAQGAARLPGRAIVGAARGAGQSLVEQFEEKTGLSVQPKHYKAAWEAKKRLTRIEREKKMIETARGRGIPTANELVTAVTTWKGPKLMAKRLARRDRPLRKRETGLIEQIKTKEEAAETKLTQTEKDNQTRLIKKDINTKTEDLKNSRSKREQAVKEGDRKTAQELGGNIKETENQIESLKEKQVKIQAKVVIPEAEKEKLVNDLQKLREERLAVHAKAEMINPTAMTYEDRLKTTRARYEEYQRLQGMEDPDELIEQYQLAVGKGESTKVEAIATKLNTNLDLNELLSTYGFKQNYQGTQELIDQHFIKKLGMNQQIAYSFGNDLSLMNKSAAAYRFGGAFVRGENGLLRKAQPKEHESFVLTESGKKDREKLWRNGWWGFAVGKKTDTSTGKRVPIWDRVTEKLIVRDLDMILAEMEKGRFSPELERNFSHQQIIGGLQNVLSSYAGATKTNLEKLISGLKEKQTMYWEPEK